MLYLPDPRTGALAELRPARPGVLRIRAMLPSAGKVPDLTALRVPLVADLIARIAEQQGLQALTVFAGVTDPAGHAAFELGAKTLGVHPPAAWTPPDDSGSRLGGPIDLDVIGGAGSPAARLSGRFIGVGAVRDQAGAGSRPPAGPASPRGHDPLAVRLALLSVPYGQAADLDQETARRAGHAIASWRLQVARWAESPSQPVPAAALHLLRTAFDRLDIGAAITVLRDLADDGDTAAGAKFEAFLQADRVLGLDLAREIGQVRA